MATKYFRTSGVLSSTYVGVPYQPVVKLDFMVANKLDPRLVYSRSTSATYINSIGNYVSASSNVPRMDYDPVTLERKGFLLEEARTNLVYWSADPNQSSRWSNSGTPTITAQAADGLFTPARVASSGTNWHRRISNSFTLAAATKYSITVLFKPGTSGNIWVEMYGDPSNTLAIAGTVTSPVVVNSPGFTVNNSPSVTVHKSGLYKLTVVCTPSTSLSTYTIGVGPNSTTVGQYIDFYGTQIEASQAPTSFIVTGSTVGSLDKARDECYVDNISSMISNQATLVCDSIMSSASSAGFLASLYTSNTNYLALGYSASGGSYAGYTYYVNSTQYNSAAPDYNTYGKYDIVTRIAAAYDSSDVVTYYSGNRLAHSGTFSGAITPQRLYLASRSASGDFDSNTWIRKVFLYNKKIDEEDMLYITRL